MKTKYLMVLVLAGFLAGCSGSGPLKDSRAIVNQYNRYLEEKPKALDRIIATYVDDEQAQELRAEALRYIIRSRDPLAYRLIQSQLKKPQTMEYWALEIIADETAQLNDPKWGTLMMNAYSALMDLRINLEKKILGSIFANTDLQSLPRFLDLYQKSYDHFLQLDDAFAKSLGKYDDDGIVPVLLKIINDPKRSLRTRERALQILADKNEPAFTEALIKLMGDPQTDQMLREFSFNVLDLTQDEEILLALLKFLDRSKERHNHMLNSALAVLEDFSDPAIIPSLRLIATDDNFPYHLRKKAVDGLIAFESPEELMFLIQALEEPHNLIFWTDIATAVRKSGDPDLYQAMEKTALALHRDFQGGAE
jgi:HEAT repeat protein